MGPTNSRRDSIRTIEPIAEQAVLRRDVRMGETTRLLHRPLVSRRQSLQTIDDELTNAMGQSAATTKDGVAAPKGVQDSASKSDGFEIGREQGHAAGLEAGYTQGCIEGRQTGEKEVRNRDSAARQAQSAQLARLDSMLRALPAQLDQRLREAEDDMVALCMTVIGRMLGEFASTVEGTKALVRQAVGELAAQPVAIIHVHPSDLVGLQADLVWQSGIAAAGKITWLGDPAIALGGCVVSTPQGDLDARLETQLAQLTSCLNDSRRRNPL